MPLHLRLRLTFCTALAAGSLPAASQADDALGANISADDLGALHDLNTDAPEDFAGLTVDEDSGRATVYLVAWRNAAALQQLRDRLHRRTAGFEDNLSIEYRLVDRSQASLDAIRDEITRDRSWASAVGGEVREWGVDTTNNVVSIGVAELTPELEDAASAQFGSAVQLREVGEFQKTSRVHDVSPFKGGIRINNTITQCSSGFAVRHTSTGLLALLTCGHCFSLNQAIFHDGRTFGRVFFRENAGNGFDRALINGQSYEASTWLGPFNSNTFTAVRGFGTVVTGQKVCIDGAEHGEICDAVVGQREICRTASDGTTCHLTQLTKPGVFLAGEGDSGGPIIRKVSNGVVAIGIQVGITTGRASEAWFHEISAVLPSGFVVLTR